VQLPTLNSLLPKPSNGSCTSSAENQSNYSTRPRLCAIATFFLTTKLLLGGFIPPNPIPQKRHGKGMARGGESKLHRITLDHVANGTISQLHGRICNTKLLIFENWVASLRLLYPPQIRNARYSSSNCYPNPSLLSSFNIVGKL
jgi:hypothetical protein